MSDFRSSLEGLRNSAVAIGKLEATNEILAGLVHLAEEYDVSRKVNNVLAEATPEEQRVADAFWRGVEFSIREMMRVIEGVKTYTEDSEKSKEED